MRAIVDGCGPEDLALGPDLGWVAHAGWDVVDFLQQFADRVEYLHVRDVTRSGTSFGFVEAGRGILDFPRLFAALTELGYAGWLVAESELGGLWRGSEVLEETARLQFAGLQAAIAGVVPPAGRADSG